MSIKKFSPKNLPSHFPKSKKEEQEFGRGKKDIQVCKKCDSIYYSKSWHHRLDDYPYLKESKQLKFTLCPACQMIRDGRFEGEIIIEGCFSKEEKMLIENTVRNIGKEGFKRDPQDRIIKIEEKKISKKDLKKMKEEIERKDKIHVLTTENQLAVRIAKKVAETFKGTMQISYSKKESTTRVRVILMKSCLKPLK